MWHTELVNTVQHRKSGEFDKFFYLLTTCHTGAFQMVSCRLLVELSNCNSDVFILHHETWYEENPSCRKSIYFTFWYCFFFPHNVNMDHNILLYPIIILSIKELILDNQRYISLAFPFKYSPYVMPSLRRIVGFYIKQLLYMYQLILKIYVIYITKLQLVSLCTVL